MMALMRSLVLLMALVFITAAASFDPPKRKSGLWEIKVSGAQFQSGITMQECIEEKTDDFMKDEMPGMEKRSCSKNEMRKEGDKIVGESVCKVKGSTAKSRTVVTGRFDSAYRMDIKTNYDPPLEGMRESSSVMEGKWLGACKPGQKPGDVSIPGMPAIPNVDDIMKGAPKKR